MADPTPDGQGLQPIVDELAKIKAAIAELQKPTGTQTARSIEAVGELVANQLYPGSGIGSGSGFSMSTTMTTFASFNFTVPEGFARALIVASGFVYSGTAAGGGDRIYGSVRVGGVDGPESIAFMTTTMLLGGVSAFNAVQLTGLTAGASIAVETRARLQFGPGDAAFAAASTATAAGIAVFLR